MEACTLRMATLLPKVNGGSGFLAGDGSSSRLMLHVQEQVRSISGDAKLVNSVRAQSLPPQSRPSAGAAATILREAVRETIVKSISPKPTQPARELTNFQGQLVLMRHGESMWNDLKLFTGDVDIPLTEKGIMEALAGGKAVSEIDFDIIFTSRLGRAKQTALIAMTQNAYKRVPVLVRGGYYGKGKTGDDNRLRLRDAAANALEHASCKMVPVYADPALNERCYGDLQGLSKEAAVKEFGEDTVRKWRRSHDTRPPNGESLQDTFIRSVHFFQQTIEPRLKEGRNVLVVAHGNVLRCIISYLSGLSDEEMLRLQVVTALPYAYTYDGNSFAECCVMPPNDPNTNHPKKGVPLGISSVLKKGEIDSLI
ncbi:2,3-bisphosphoglycerate-dependent phosphoglycerate mutase [Marchantia polymorpha subsp. ruderalis]|uniref:phosphoglycerate mutase (2,3-diphosphoglycerate-dependent) n=2 Tax=Marchantia polymorpha TaxID=3197 RepID=A0A176VIU5_MARPO|nr:hypothetical protein AXG93_2964s1110 [Marchantia polymorpha subsp. ruderalis]PTQ35309.1 hypothetical protein MARPO_0072s0053 [Marchantia polymorpha]BBN03343.1 hypothetical protein Mp_2g22790 [Marchantia polymorpha subsp. ruderalis]|eukprot:PTQ35309.1 hypothetical protein MARPO_0072s0053 [Marchantia polymorpha]